VETLIRSNAIDVVVLDSVAALVSKTELEGQMGDATVGLQARMMSQAMRGRVTGNRTRVKVVKNKVAPPFTECEFDINFDEGISRSGSLLDLGIEHKILEKKGAWIAYQGNLIGQGREAAKKYLDENQKIAVEVKKAIMEKVHVTGGATIAEKNGKEEDEK